LGGLGDPFACHMGHIGLGPHPKSKQALILQLEDFVARSFYTSIERP